MDSEITFNFASTPVKLEDLFCGLEQKRHPDLRSCDGKPKSTTRMAIFESDIPISDRLSAHTYVKSNTANLLRHAPGPKHSN